jgi:hypothetical protein
MEHTRLNSSSYWLVNQINTKITGPGSPAITSYLTLVGFERHNRKDPEGSSQLQKLEFDAILQNRSTAATIGYKILFW